MIIFHTYLDKRNLYLLTCLRWGSNVGSKKAQVLETTTTTSPVITTAGTLINLNIDTVLLVKLSQSKKRKGSTGNHIKE